ncbi:MAG TPA: hypothetical protein VEG34_07220 [Thermoanaerobaculia bacterium]|nr:hypothetical protein [Thermoanaerobaculia bacterium]
MKYLALLVAVALLALAVPASAAEVSPASTAASAAPLELPAEGQFTPIDLLIITPIQYCSSVHGTSCPARSGPRSCTDVCQNQLRCDCRFYSGAWRWYCQQEC